MSDPVDTDALRGVAHEADQDQYYRWSEVLYAAADEVDRLRVKLAEVQDDAENGWKAAGQWERTASDVKAAADVFLDDRNELRTVIENAPHAHSCMFPTSTHPTGSCTCWKADAL